MTNEANALSERLIIESGVILPTWPVQTAVLRIEGQKKLLVLAIKEIEFDEIKGSLNEKEGEHGNG